jgi:amino acid adenylation domain-containing protein
MTLLAGYLTFLRRTTGQDDVIVGFPVSGRSAPHSEHLIAYCSHLLAMRCPPVVDLPFEEYLSMVKAVLLEAYEHQEYPFAKLLERLNLPTDPSRSPVVSVTFNMERRISVPNLFGLTAELLPPPVSFSEFDLHLNLTEVDGRLMIDLVYDTELFEADTARRMLGQFQNVLEAVVTDASQPISALPLLSDGERRQILEVWNDTQREYEQNLCLHQLIEVQVEKTPDAIAVAFEGEELTYRQLDERANQLAHHLRGLGVGPETPVGVHMDRSVEMVVGLMGALKAGAAYLPLDPSYPHDRLKFMLEDAHVPVILTQSRLADRLPGNQAAIVRVDADWEAISRGSKTSPISGVGPDNLAYIIYTSGSTGQPKGAMVTHRGICNRLLWMQEAYQLTEQDRVLQKTPFSFDVSVWEFFWPLLTGARLVVARPGGHKENAYLVKLIAEQEITTLHFVPSMLRVFLEETGAESCRSVRQVICSGEALPVEVQQQFFSVFKAALHNLYGPTEASVDVTYWPCAPNSNARTVPIGRPIANIQTYILDRYLNPVPAGVPGELHLAGVGLGRGYLQRPDLTALKFIPNPFGVLGSRLYKTGDLVRYLPTGDIEFLGRLDHQVKIRGFRIELQEIECLLDQHPSIRQSVVLAREDEPGIRRLVAYFVSGADAAPTAHGLRAYLGERLPEHAVPSAFIRLDALPLSPNGKVDRRALPAPSYSRSDLEGAVVGPRDGAESILAEIWASVLKLDTVGIRDNFFELGGDSIQAIQATAKANRAGLAITAKQLFESPTIADLAAVAGDSHAGETLVISTNSEQSAQQSVDGDPGIEDTYPLSPMQRGMMYHCLNAPAAREYLEQASLVLRGALNVPALEQAWKQVIDRHPVLRTAFVWDGLEEPMQAVHREGHLDMEYRDLRGLPAARRNDEVAAYIHHEQQNGFDLSQPTLMRLALFRIGDDEHQLVWSNHHLILDGWSKPLIIAEVRTCYEALCENREFQLEQTRPYRDYIEWLRQVDLAEAEVFWRGRLKGFRVPTGFGGSESTGSGFGKAEDAYDYLDAVLAPQTTAALQNLCRQHKLTLNTLAQGAWALLLSRYSGDPNVVFGGVVSGRQMALAGVESMVGLFINTLPIHVRVPNDVALVPWLQEIQAEQIEARQYEYSPLVDVQRWSDVPRGSRLFESILVFGNRPEDCNPSWALTEWSFQRSGYPLHVEFNPGQEFGIRITYNSSRFSKAAIARMLGHLQNLLEGIAADPEQCPAAVPLLSDSEKHRTLIEWNDTHADLQVEHTFAELFEAQVEKAPDAIAAVFKNEELTYREVNARANRIGRSLVKQGVRPEVTVAVLTERGFEWLAAVLSVFKAGGVYLPLDPGHPPARLRQVLEQSGSRIILTTQAFVQALSRVLETWPDEDRPQVCLIEDLSRGEESDENIPARARAEDLAYVIYTSGSTGRPKGAMVEHAGMLNHLYAKITDLKLGPSDVVAQTASQCFDISVWQLLAAFLAGGQVHILGDQVLRDPGWLLDEIEAADVSIVEVVPSLLRVLVVELERRPMPLPALRWMIVTGEALPPALWRAWLKLYPDVPLLNAYGPTECSDDVSHYAMYQPPAGEVQVTPIGRPIANAQLYILDSDLRPVPIGLVGELCVGGVCVGRGYLNDREQTSRAFVTNPFAKTSPERMYRTGDLARFREDGNIELLGRLDDQVKVRGYRIELGEIEAALTQHPAVLEAVAVAREDASGDGYLTAYLVAGQHPEPSTSELRSLLETKVPEYMVPSLYVWLTSLPLTANGKVNRRALPVPERTKPELNGHFVPPRTREEQLLAGIWEEVLGVERVGVHDNFFELGGNSLSATRVLARLPGELQARLPLRRMFEAPTIARLATDLIDGSVAPSDLAMQAIAGPNLLPAAN